MGYFEGSTWEQVSLSAVYFIATALAMVLTYYFYVKILLRLTKNTKTDADDLLAQVTEAPVVMGVGIIGLWHAVHELSLSAEAISKVESAFYLLIAFNITWLIHRIVNALYDYLVEPRLEVGGFENTLFPLARKILLALIWALSLITSLQSVGFNLTTIVAGFGLVGFAFAVAFRGMLENVISGIYIMSTDLYRKGERVVVGRKQQDLIVVSLGFLSTTFVDFFTRREVTLSNTDITANPMINVSREPVRWVRWVLKLCNLRNSPDQLVMALYVVEDVVQNHDNAEFAWQYFSESNEFSHQLDIKLGIKDTTYLEQTRNEILIEVLHRFREEGVHLTQYGLGADSHQALPASTFSEIGSNLLKYALPKAG